MDSSCRVSSFCPVDGTELNRGPHNEVKKRILLISAAAPPSGGSHATRIAALIEAMVAAAMDVSLVTCKSSEERKTTSAQFRRIASLATVIEVTGGALRASAEAVTRLGNKRQIFGDVVQRLRTLVRKMAIPDTFIFWVPGAVKYALAHIKNSGGADIVLSSGAPFSSHIAAYLVSRISGVPMALDYGDPWVFEPGRRRRGLRLLLERATEHQILQRARLVSLTTKPTADLYRKTYADIAAKLYVMPMGYNNADFPDQVVDSGPPRAGLDFIYAGRINEEYRSISKLSAILDACEDYRGPHFTLNFYGSEFGTVRRQLSKHENAGRVVFNRHVDHEEYVIKLRNADGLLIFGNNNYIQIPGKIPEYLAAGRPLLYFPNVDRVDLDPTLALIHCIQRSDVFIGQTVADFRLFVASSATRLRPSQQLDRLRELEWGSICGEYCQHVRKICRE